MITNSGNLNLNLDTDTDAFKAAPAEELATMLRHIADQIEDGMTSGYRLADSGDEGLTAWSVDLPEPSEEDAGVDIEDVDNLDEKYVAFVSKLYQTGGKKKEAVIQVYSLNFNLSVGENISLPYLEDLAREDTNMGPKNYLFHNAFRTHLEDNGDLPDNADELFAFVR